MKYSEIRHCSYISTFMFLVSLILNKHFVLIKNYFPLHPFQFFLWYHHCFFFFQLYDRLNLLSQFTADNETNAVCKGPLTKKTDSFPQAVIIANRFLDRDWSLSKEAHYLSML